MSLSLQAGVTEAIRAHGVETYPNECCGALIGRDGVVTHTLALPNVTEEGPRRRFRVSDRDYLQCEKRARELGGDLLGFYHSHPDHPARPSQYDLEHAWPTYSYIIVSTRANEATDLFSWEQEPDRSRFNQEEIKSA